MRVGGGESGSGGWIGGIGRREGELVGVGGRLRLRWMGEGWKGGERKEMKGVGRDKAGKAEEAKESSEPQAGKRDREKEERWEK